MIENRSRREPGGQRRESSGFAPNEYRLPPYAIAMIQDGKKPTAKSDICRIADVSVIPSSNGFHSHAGGCGQTEAPRFGRLSGSWNQAKNHRQTLLEAENSATTGKCPSASPATAIIPAVDLRNNEP